jgi:hypothetical protein
MRKLLLLASVLPLFVFGQNNEITGGQKQPKAIDVQSNVQERLVGKLTVNPAVRIPLRKDGGLKTTKIGQTRFDQQTNAAMPQRIVVDSGGAITAVWMYSNLDATTDRGSNFNHFDGTAWLGERSNRIENVRSGYNSICNVTHKGVRKNVIISHLASGGTADDSTTGGMFLMMNDKLGSDNWTIKTVMQPRGPMWPRVAATNKYIHIIANYAGQTDRKKNKIIDKVEVPTVYFRYSLAGDSFDINGELLPGYDTLSTLNGDADSYTIDAKDNTVAIVMGGTSEDVAMWKSNDEGTTWKKTIVYKCPFAPFVGPKDILFDTTLTNNGAVHVTLDNSKIAHVFYPVTVALNDNATDSSFVTIFRVDGISYWNDKDTTTVPMVGRIPIPEGGDSTAPWPLTGNFNRIPGSPITTVGSAAYYMTSSISTWPTAAVDDSNIVYLVYSSINTNRTLSQQTFRDVYCRYSRDYGKTWSKIMQLSNNDLFEFAYPSVARNASNGLNIVWQQDQEPGNSITNQDTKSDNEIIYATISLSDLKEGNIVQVGINENNLINGLLLYPNPSKTELNIRYSLKNTANVQVKVTNTIGQVISIENKGQSTGLQQSKLNTADLPVGIYFVEINANGSITTQKFVKE